MTDREIKLELAKAALHGCSSIELAKVFYDWVVKSPELELVDTSTWLDKKLVDTQYDNIPIEELAYKTRSEGIVIKRCKENGINTVGDLIRCGAHKFMTFRLVGRRLTTVIDDVLEEYYDYKDFFTT